MRESSFRLLCIANFYSRKTHSDWSRQRKKQSWEFRRNVNYHTGRVPKSLVH